MLVRLVTCRPLPEPDVDEEPLLAALRAAGLDARMAVWDDPAETWEGGLTVIRSTWDYHRHLDAFLAWVDRAAARSSLWNPARVVRFSAHKSYLAALAAAGLPVMPTVYLAKGANARLDDILADKGWTDVVVKPTVSAGSFKTERFRQGDAGGQTFLDALLAERDVMVQPYLRSVEGYGERSVIWIDGAVTHSVRKSPRFGTDQESVSEAVAPAADERALAEQFVAHVGGELLYARVDLARDEQGRPLLMELELLEPSLFLVQHPPALERLVLGIRNRIVS
jgi:glutathione synthase/RimK-type ligase-like ATP-grasp enzyme